MQATRPDLPVLRDLWRVERILGLRPIRGRTKTEHQGVLVAFDDTMAGRCGGAGSFDHYASANLGSQRPHQHIQRFDGGLPVNSATLSSGSNRAPEWHRLFLLRSD